MKLTFFVCVLMMFGKIDKLKCVVVKNDFSVYVNIKFWLWVGCQVFVSLNPWWQNNVSFLFWRCPFWLYVLKINEDSFAVFMCYLIQTRTRTEEEVRTLERLHQQQTSSYSSRFDNLTIPFPLRSFPSPVSFFFSYKDYEKRLEVCRAVNIRDTLCVDKRERICV